MNKKTYDNNVKEAREIMAILRMKNHHRVKVASIALNVCTIIHGGRRPKADRYTLKKFSNDIGINPKTLTEWIRFKQIVYDKLNDDNKLIADECPASINRMMLAEVDRKSTKRTVNSKFNRYSNVDHSDDYRFRKYLEVMNTIIYNLSNYSRTTCLSEEIIAEACKRALTIDAMGRRTLKIKGGNLKDKTFKPKRIDNENDFWRAEIGV